MVKRFAKASLASGAVVSILLVRSFALTASNTVPTSKAGSGTGVISGYTLTNVHYGLNETTPSNIDSVTFDVDAAPPAGAVLKVKLVAAGSTYYTCTNVSTAVTCNTTSPQATVAASDQLLVVAAQ